MPREVIQDDDIFGPPSAQPEDDDIFGPPSVVPFPQQPFADLRSVSRWVAWLDEKGRKIPYSVSGGKAAVDNPTTWAVRDRASAHALGIGGNVGIMLGALDGGCLGGVDLDGCRDPATGEIEPWARAIIGRFDTYGEVSPSETGAKLFFRFDPADMPRFRERFDGGEWGRSFSRNHHGPELHLGRRWYAVTERRLPGCPASLRTVDAEDILWLLAEAGPSFGAPDGGAEGARSERLMGIAASVKRAGGEFEEYVAAARADPAAWAHVTKHGRDRAQDRALRRAWDNSDAAPLNLDNLLEEIPADELPDQSDIGLAVGFTRAGWGDRARYCGPLGGWLLWDGARWARAEKREEFTAVQVYLSAEARRLVEGAKDAEAAQRARKVGVGLKSAARVAAIEGLARSRPGAAVAPGDFDADDWALGTPSGVVDLRTGDMRPAAREDYLTKNTAIGPAERGARPERWLRFLAECFPEDPAIPAFLQRLAGYALTGSTREHKLFFFWGEGRNGKGTFLNTLSWIFGNYAQTVAPTVLLEARNPMHSAPLAMLRGARLARASEISSGAAWNEAELKRLSGGDPITANLMRQDPITFVPKLTLIVDANRRPRIRTVDAAMRARMVFVPWRRVFTLAEQDARLPETLKAEGSAILRWAIAGAVAWGRDGLGIPASIADASDDYLESEDELGQFLADHTIVDRAARVSAAALHQRFRVWQQERGDREWSQRALSVALQERGFTTFQGREDGVKMRGFEGIRLRDLPDGALQDPPDGWL